MIFGLTHRPDGTLIHRLTIAYKVSIGIPATDGRNFPSKDDHFHIRAKNANGDWVDDNLFAEDLRNRNMPEITVDNKKTRAPLREFDVVFLQDGEEQDPQGHWMVPDSIFQTELAWWAASEKRCSGNGVAAMRSLAILSKEEQAKHPGERYAPWLPCGDACPDLDQGRCKPSGRLRFIFKDRPIMGSVAEYSTTSYETIARIQSSLVQIMSITGGRLRGIPLKMVLRPGRTSYVDKQGARKTGSAFFVNLEFRQSDFAQLVPKLIEHSAQYAKDISRGQRLIGSPREIEEVEEDGPTIEDLPEKEAADAMTAEFYPDNREAVIAETMASMDDTAIANICSSLGLNAAHREMLGRSLKGDVGEMLRWITEFRTGVQGIPAADVHAFYTRVVLTPDKLGEALKDLQAKASSGATPKTRKTKKEQGHPQAPAVQQQPAPAASAAPAAATSPAAEENLGSFNF